MKVKSERRDLFPNALELIEQCESEMHQGVHGFDTARMFDCESSARAFLAVCKRIAMDFDDDGKPEC